MCIPKDSITIYRGKVFHSLNQIRRNFVCVFFFLFSKVSYMYFLLIFFFTSGSEMDTYHGPTSVVKLSREKSIRLD